MCGNETYVIGFAGIQLTNELVDHFDLHIGMIPLEDLDVLGDFWSVKRVGLQLGNEAGISEILEPISSSAADIQDSPVEALQEFLLDRRKALINGLHRDGNKNRRQSLRNTPVEHEEIPERSDEGKHGKADANG